MSEKHCFKCGIIRPIDDFYRHPRMADGHLNKCKECAKRDAKEHYRDAIDKIREYGRERERRPERRASKAKYQKRRRALNPEKQKVRAKTSYAIRSGAIPKQPCEVCGNPIAQAHHEDYTKPYEVRWLCFVCHRRVHGQNPATAKDTG